MCVSNRRDASAGGGIVARDAIGSEVTSKGWLADHKAGDHSLVQGLKVRFERSDCLSH